jgi:chemotaxis response regulator CheB
VTDQVRVALLARAGQARDQLHKALDEAGALIVVEGDPNELDPREVSEKLPKVFLVSLEPATEKAIDKFDGLFGADGIEVMFDDAEVTAKLDGWDLNRWARHLVSKLLGRESLPPAPEGAPAIGEAVDEANDAGAMLQPGLPPTPAEEMSGAKLEDYTAESPELAEWVPTSPSLTPAKAESPEAENFTWDGSGADDGEAKEFKLDTDLGIDIDLGALDSAPAPTPAAAELEGSTGDVPAFPDLPEGMRFSSFDSGSGSEELGDIDADVAALAAQLEAFEKTDTRSQPSEPEFARATQSKEEKAKEAAAAPKGGARGADKAPPKQASPAGSAGPAKAPAGESNFDFSKLSLSPLDELEKAPPIEVKFSKSAETAAPAAPKPSAFGSLSLEGDDVAPAPVAPPRTAAASSSPGAVLILAGLGGPDAVRQLLSSLPETLAVPVLLYQHLEVGKHERLVDQLAKISKLPVALAKDGESPQAGRVSLLPAGMTAVTHGTGLRFSAGTLSQLLSALPPAGSMVIVLSGADAQLVPMILALKDGGGVVLAQDPEICFDAAAAEAMRKEGAPVFPALGLARQVAARWPQ